MDKPASLIAQETKEKIVEIINQSGLPMFVIEYIINDIHNQVAMAKAQELEQDKLNYDKSLEQEKEEKEDGI